MQIKSILLAATCATSTFAAPTVEERGTSVCTSGINAQLVPILSKAQAAQAFCASLYPVKCTTAGTSTTTTTTTTSAAAKGTPLLNIPGLNVFGSLNPFGGSNSASANLDLNAWFKLMSQPTSTISSFCSCIQTPKAC